MPQFTSTNMRELESMFNLSSAQRLGFDSVPSDFADILSTFNWAMHEGSSALISKDFPDSQKIDDTLHFVGHYCHVRNIDYGLLYNETDNCFHLHLY
ncbi:hypothetical protein RB620_24635 [Paenibacillus sp. LHD-117]|uniref:hypothetical protein n=1 Tax=Paenibacillus sp. LHD-117 TaxID=3071412 RepID=UPI0027E1B988|nr:hypothetical protein [Paenibacillus sp. LHD-117]MDQ6422624.1 hypothetical protein [Paenibacillus sp. LHD-117]